MSWRIFEYVEWGYQSTIGIWLIENAITDRDRGRLVQKMDLLAMHGPNLPPGLLAGPIKSKRNRKMQSHIYKLIIHGDKMLRPMLCKGPIEMDSEYTMLIGAIEVNFKLDVDAEDAELRRTDIIENPDKRRINGRYK
jgi:hypothetical protein